MWKPKVVVNGFSKREGESVGGGRGGDSCLLFNPSLPSPGDSISSQVVEVDDLDGACGQGMDVESKGLLGGMLKLRNSEYLEFKA